ncbi:hypothetical protein FGB62_69g242 [Gracilaria domingensis]|nr:hypothetical protein FGB62_69g242 [Gracilaria domingensis]
MAARNGGASDARARAKRGCRWAMARRGAARRSNARARRRRRGHAAQRPRRASARAARDARAARRAERAVANGHDVAPLAARARARARRRALTETSRESTCRGGGGGAKRRSCARVLDLLDLEQRLQRADVRAHGAQEVLHAHLAQRHVLLAGGALAAAQVGDELASGRHQLQRALEDGLCHVGVSQCQRIAIRLDARVLELHALVLHHVLYKLLNKVQNPLAPQQALDAGRRPKAGRRLEFVAHQLAERAGPQPARRVAQPVCLAAKVAAHYLGDDGRPQRVKDGEKAAHGAIEQLHVDVALGRAQVAAVRIVDGVRERLRDGGERRVDGVAVDGDGGAAGRLALRHVAAHGRALVAGGNRTLAGARALSHARAQRTNGGARGRKSARDTEAARALLYLRALQRGAKAARSLRNGRARLYVRASNQNALTLCFAAAAGHSVYY